jgi:orotate phosphoribosyltransferase
MNDDDADLPRRLYEVSHLVGSFTLRSGRAATEYFDKFQFTADPGLLRRIATKLTGLVPPDTDLLGGLELGGVPLAVALSLETGIPVVYVRKERKTYGTAKLAEGPPFAGRRVVVVDDVLSTGGAVLDGVRELRAEGALVDTALLVIDRETGGAENLAAEGITLRSLFRMSDLDAATAAGAG